jgi:6-phosphogluconolactonase (cycloisomerase 2 family)
MERMRKKLLAIFTILIAVSAAVSATTLIYGQPTLVGKVYTMDNAATGNNVWQFNRMSDGSLVLAGNFSTMGNGTGVKLDSQGAVTLSKNGNWLFVVDAGSNEISVFAVNSTALTLTDKVSSHGTTPISVTVWDNWVYVLNNGSSTIGGNVAGFKVNSTGQLTFVAGSNQPLSGMMNSSPEQIGFNPNGTMLVVTEKAVNMTDIYTVDNNGVAGTPMPMASVGTGPFGFAFTSTNFLVMSEAASNTMSSFAWTDNGSLRTISGALPDFQMAPCWVVITENDQWAFTTNAASGTISTYAISPNGILLLTSSIAAKISSPALDMALTSGSEFLYTLNGNDITGFQVFNDGGLWQVSNMTGLPPATTGLAAT